MRSSTRLFLKNNWSIYKIKIRSPGGYSVFESPPPPSPPPPPPPPSPSPLSPPSPPSPSPFPEFGVTPYCIPSKDNAKACCISASSSSSLSAPLSPSPLVPMTVSAATTAAGAPAPIDGVAPLPGVASAKVMATYVSSEKAGGSSSRLMLRTQKVAVGKRWWFWSGAEKEMAAAAVG